MHKIFKGWSRFLLFETVEDLKQNPREVEKLAQDVSKENDKGQLELVMKALLNDPEVKAAAEELINLEKELKQGNQNPQENIIQDFGLAYDTMGQAAGAKASVLLQNKTVQNLVKYGGPILALALILKSLSAGGAFSPGMMKATSNLVAAGQSTDQLTNGIEMALRAGAGAMTEDEEGV
jgi:hypothetical protein